MTRRRPPRRRARPADRPGRFDLPQFVVHRHASSILHYDVRLEVGGVLRSWSLPKGPATDPAERRLAVDIGTHPLDLVGFEGVAPDPHGGTGTAIVWDRGTYENLTVDGHDRPVALEDAIEGGLVTVRLHGQRLVGGYTLERFQPPDQWLLAKLDDRWADPDRRPARTELTSVVSGRTNAELARWHQAPTA